MHAADAPPPEALSLLKSKLPRPRGPSGPLPAPITHTSSGKPLVRTKSLPQGFVPMTGALNLPRRLQPLSVGGEQVQQESSPHESTRRVLQFGTDSPLDLESNSPIHEDILNSVGRMQSPTVWHDDLAAAARRTRQRHNALARAFASRTLLHATLFGWWRLVASSSWERRGRDDHGDDETFETAPNERARPPSSPRPKPAVVGSPEDEVGSPDDGRDDEGAATGAGCFASVVCSPCSCETAPGALLSLSAAAD